MTFIEKALAIHGEKYNYDNVVYVHSRTPVDIICPKHGLFQQRPDHHLSGKGCRKCYDERQTGTKDTFIEKALAIHGQKYNYELVNYINSYSAKVDIICPVHGKFSQLPSIHLQGSGCRKCARNLSQSEFEEKASVVHTNIYNYSNSQYINHKTKLDITCDIHGIFSQSANNHLKGEGCPICKSSKGELIIANYLTKNNISFIKEYKISECKNILALPFDFAIFDNNELKYLIEYHGKQHFEAVDFFGGEGKLLKQQQNDFIKLNYCFNNNIKLLVIHDGDEIAERISLFQQGVNITHLTKDYKSLPGMISFFQDEWINKNKICRSIINQNKNKIMGRKCILKEISNRELKTFLNDNHLQGWCKAKYAYALYYDSEMVACMTWDVPRYTNKYDLELIRLCFKIDTTILGGSKKLFNHSINELKPKNIVSYCNIRVFTGEVYDGLGFVQLPQAKPTYYYTDGNNRYNRVKYQKHKCIENHPEWKSMTEKQICQDKFNLYRVWDLGQATFVKTTFPNTI